MTASKIPAWILQCLDQYGNCACGRAIVKKLGRENLLEELAAGGRACELEIISDQKDGSALPKDGTYILTLKSRLPEEDEEDEVPDLSESPEE